jgi:AraC-like DNA-binding protein/mannose-6-phosphate isomerase-like protein (cupin superfamily)
MPQRPTRINHFSTQDLPAESRLAHWSLQFGQTLGYAGLESPDGHNFHQTLTRVDLGLTRFLRLRGSETASHAEAGHLPESEHRPFHLLIRLGYGATTLVQEREVTIEPGDMVLLDARREFRLQSRPTTDFLAIGFPEALVARWLPCANDAVAVRLEGRAGWAGTLSAYLRALDASLLESIDSAFEEELVGEHMLSMLSFALAQRGFPMTDEERVPARDRVLHARMCSWIRDNYGNPEVNATVLARHFNVSVRYVHKVFAGAGQGMTFRETLKHERLEAAVRMLRTATVSHTLVAQIAERCGFSDPAYFGLVFRKEFGSSPGTFARRKGRMPEAPDKETRENPDNHSQVPDE